MDPMEIPIKIQETFKTMIFVVMCCSLPCWCIRSRAANAKTPESKIFNVFAGSLTISDSDATKRQVDHPINNMFLFHVSSTFETAWLHTQSLPYSLCLDTTH